MQPGKLRHRITIQQYVQTVNADRESVLTWETLTTARADLKNLSGREFLQADKNQSISTHSLLIRINSKTELIAPKMRVLLGRRIFGINYQTRDRTDNRRTIIYVTEKLD